MVVVVVVVVGGDEEEEGKRDKTGGIRVTRSGAGFLHTSLHRRGARGPTRSLRVRPS